MMRYTIFDTPGISPALRALAIASLKVFGWRVEGRLSDDSKFVVIAAPHTSNWDLPILLGAAFALKAKAFWLGKHTLFRWPFGYLFKWMGGLPVNRSAPHGLVSQSIEMFRNNEELILAIPPEGTRGKVRYWKTGFYYIATGAEVPIAFGFIDYQRKAAGLGPMLYPTGDIEADMEVIRGFYANVTGKYPDQSSTAVFVPK
jgi:1-acyl-sn-glycerol-3-phosphate acyltransferase